jgi:hypothetical protein
MYYHSQLSHCSFDLHFHNDQKYQNSFHVLFAHLYTLFKKKKSVQFLFPVLIGLFGFELQANIQYSQMTGKQWPEKLDNK